MVNFLVNFLFRISVSSGALISSFRGNIEKEKLHYLCEYCFNEPLDYIDRRASSDVGRCGRRFKSPSLPCCRGAHIN